MSAAEAMLKLAETHRIVIDQNPKHPMGGQRYIAHAVPLSLFNMMGTAGYGATPEAALENLFVELARKRLSPPDSFTYEHLEACSKAAQKPGVFDDLPRDSYF